MSADQPKSLFWKMFDGELPMPKAAKLLGAEITNIDVEAGTIEVEFLAKDEFTNPVGDVQGGILAAMLDDTMGPALTAMLPAGEFAPTLEIKVNFLKPAKVGKLLGKGKVVSKGRQVCVLEGELYQGDRMVARGTATALIQKMSS